MTQAQFAEHYHIVEENDYNNYKRLFEDEETQLYFAYAEEDDIFQVPDEFFAWLNGDSTKFTYSSLVETAYQFISFIGKFVDLLEKCSDINKTSFEKLKKYYQFLEKLKKLEEWQEGKIRLSKAESIRLVNYFLDYTMDSTRKRTKKFPKIANWLTIEYNEDGTIKQLPQDIAERAFQNFIPIPLKPTSELKLCYSFELFIEDAALTGAWYSVEQFDFSKNDSMVFSYEFDRKSNIFDSFIKAFHYLIETYPEVKKVLQSHDSRMLNIH